MRWRLEKDKIGGNNMNGYFMCLNRYYFIVTNSSRRSMTLAEKVSRYIRCAPEEIYCNMEKAQMQEYNQNGVDRVTIKGKTIGIMELPASQVIVLDRLDWT